MPKEINRLLTDVIADLVFITQDPEAGTPGQRASTPYSEKCDAARSW